MDYIAQCRVMNPRQQPFLNRQRTPDYNCAAISRIYTRSLYQRHIPKLGQIMYFKSSIQNPLKEILQTSKSMACCVVLNKAF